MNTLGARKYRRAATSPVTLAFFTLSTLNRLPAQVQSKDGIYPYVGCFEDAESRVMPTQIALRADELTLARCAADCLADTETGWKYAGLEFGQECISFGTGRNETSEALCDAFGAAGVYNSMPDGMGCYWDLPQEEGGNADRMLAPGESFRYNLHETDNDVRWSGTLWASTGCDKINGCATGICNSPDTDHVCPAYVGPSGPTTKAEFTLSDSSIDFYDVSNIDGANLPVMIQPDRPVYPEGATSNSLKYQCGAPGSPSSPTDLSDCNWSFDDFVPSFEGNLGQYLRLVLPEGYENFIECESGADCAGTTCGVHHRWKNGAYNGGVLQGICGMHVAWRANMYGCHGGALSQSGCTPGAYSTVCGCPDWENAGIVAPAISECVGINPGWVDVAQPWAEHLKKACPTAYTFPYDDQTSTFTCQDLEGGVNTQSYTITFCRGNTEEAMFA